MRTLIKNARILDKNGTLLTTPGFIAIRDRFIEQMGPMADLPRFSTIDVMIEAEDCIAMPGLINTHCHAAMTLFRGLADDLPLMRWLQDHIFPAEAKFIDAETVYWCTKLAAAEMLLSGTTTVADGYFHEDAAARAFTEAGIRAVAAHGIIDFPAPGAADPAKNVETVDRFVEQWQDRSPLLTPAYFCHSPYTCSPETLSRAKRAAREHQALFFTHLAETQDECRELREGYGTSPVRHLASLGVLDEHTVCVHCVHLDEEEIRIIADSGAAVSTCPKSNMKLASGCAPVPDMLAKGVRLGLGTDSAASNNRLDLFHEMDFLAAVHKGFHKDPTCLPAPKVLEVATRSGADVLQHDKKIGALAPGMLADLILIDTHAPQMTPCYSADSLVYAASSGLVQTVLVDGRVVVEDRKLQTFDLGECLDEVTARSRNVAAFAKK